MSANDKAAATFHPQPEWDGTFTPAQQALYDEVEANTEALLTALDDAARCPRPGGELCTDQTPCHGCPHG